MTGEIYGAEWVQSTEASNAISELEVGTNSVGVTENWKIPNPQTHTRLDYLIE